MCDHCVAKCCRYYALAIDTPKRREDFDTLRWFLLHDAAALFVDEGAWYLLVMAECRHLLPDHRCGIYYTRPQICRDYSTDNCEYDDNAVYDQYFETATQLEEFVDAFYPADGAQLRSRKPELLPILG